jgi:hypothetical protein
LAARQQNQPLALVIYLMNQTLVEGGLPDSLNEVAAQRERVSAATGRWLTSVNRKPTLLLGW